MVLKRRDTWAVENNVLWKSEGWEEMEKRITEGKRETKTCETFHSRKNKQWVTAVWFISPAQDELWSSSSAFAAQWHHRGVWSRSLWWRGHCSGCSGRNAPHSRGREDRTPKATSEQTSYDTCIPASFLHHLSLDTEHNDAKLHKIKCAKGEPHYSKGPLYTTPLELTKLIILVFI